jgi:hypothetical protein
MPLLTIRPPGDLAGIAFTNKWFAGRLKRIMPLPAKRPLDGISGKGNA